MLFNKNSNGSLEIFQLTGAFEANTPFLAIESEIRAATTEVGACVGKAVIDHAQEIYDKTTPDADELKYLENVRRPIAFLAVGNYAKTTILRHDATGRKMTVGDNERVPFEWMIDRDDRELRERYFRALDTLFAFLYGAGDSSWKETQAYKNSEECLVKSLPEMEDVYPIEHSYYTYYRLLPLMLEAQRRLLKISGVTTLPEELLGAARRYIVLSALVTALKRWAITIFPTEVARQFAPSYQGNKEKRVATTEEIEWAISKLEAQALEAETEILEVEKGNPYKGFPLIPENDPKNKYFTT